MYQHILIPTDGSRTAAKAITGGVKLAKEMGARVSGFYAQEPLPLHIYGVGSSAFGQVQLRDAAVADVLFVDDLVAVPVRYRVRGVTRGRACDSGCQSAMPAFHTSVSAVTTLVAIRRSSAASSMGPCRSLPIA